MRSLILSLLAFATFSFAQPVEGPYEVYSTNGEQPLQYLHVTNASEDSVDCFFQFGNDVYHLKSDIHSGGWIEEPDILPMNGEGWTRHLYDAVATDSGWAAAILDRSDDFNRVVLYRKSSIDSSGFELINLHDTGSFENPADGANLHAVALGASPNSSIGVVMQDEWSHYNDWPPGQGWWEGGAGVTFFVADGIQHDYPAEDGFGGFWDDGHTRSVLSFQGNDSALVFCGGYDVTSVMGLHLGESGDNFFTSENHVYLGAPREACTVAANQILLLTSSHLIAFSNSIDFDTIATVDSEPIASASHPNFGIAWLSRYSHGLMLNRVDTTGTITQEPGILYWPEPGYEVEEANLTVMDDGRIVAFWSEHQLDSSPYAQQIKIASVGWDTFLNSDEQPSPVLPDNYSLSAYPNPFNSEVRINFSIPKNEHITLSAYDVSGRLAATIADQDFSAGDHTAHWSPQGSAGMYFVRLETAQSNHISKVLYLK